MSTTLERDAAPAASAVIPETRVVMRRWRTRPGTVIALMPDTEAGRLGVCQSYTHSGKVGSADYALTITQTTGVDLRDQEVVDLLEELRGAGYRPRIILRYSRPA